MNVTAADDLVVVDDDIVDLVYGLLEILRASLCKARDMLARGDLDGIRRIGHRMKGSGGSYGFQAVSRLGEAIEDAARDGDEAVIASQLGALEAHLGRVVVKAAGGATLHPRTVARR